MRMRCPTPPSSANSHSSTHQTLLRNPTKPMEKLQHLVFKLAQAQPNAEALLRDRLHRFVSDYRTPDHPPYSAMIQNALEELNERRGSSEESISKFLEKRYDDLPWGHSALLKHHLQKSCESGEIVLTRADKYQLAGSLKPSTRLKSKPRRRKWRWDCERQKHNLRKSKLNKKRSKQAEEIKEKCFTENGVYDDDEQTKSLPSRVDLTISTPERPPGF